MLSSHGKSRSMKTRGGSTKPMLPQIKQIKTDPKDHQKTHD